MLDYPGGSNAITSILKNGRGTQKRSLDQYDMETQSAIIGFERGGRGHGQKNAGDL